MRAWGSVDRVEAIPLWKALGFALAPVEVYHAELIVSGYYAVKVLLRK